MEPTIRIAATATALPPHEITRDDVKRYFGSTFAIDERRLNAMMSIVDGAQVRRRFFIHPVDYIIEPRPLATVTREYQEHSIALGQQVAEACLQKAGLAPSDVDLIITTSCTGFMIPSLDAHLINRMGFRPDIRDGGGRCDGHTPVRRRDDGMRRRLGERVPYADPRDPGG